MSPENSNTPPPGAPPADAPPPSAAPADPPPPSAAAPSNGDEPGEPAPDLREAFEQVLAPLREVAVNARKLLKQIGGRLDAMSGDLGRDVSDVGRDFQSFIDLARDRIDTLVRATPRAARLAQAGGTLIARQRLLRMAAAARGEPGLRDDDQRDLARRTAKVAGELRGGIAKLGQLASCRPDLIGPIWAAELATLQDDAPPVDAAAIRARITAELGRPLEEVFAEFDDTPLAAASLAQVHAARLRDDIAGGAAVAVKVQIPGIEDILQADLAALRGLASTLNDIPGTDLATIADELTRALTAELDYTAEAVTLQSFVTTAVIPRPIPAASSARVLTMTRLDGQRLGTALDAMPAADRDRLLGAMVDDFAAQILVRGHVHADPHPGNFLVLTDGRLGMLDFGCTLVLDARERAAYARLVLAIAAADPTGAAAELATLGFTADDPAQLAALTASLIGALRPGTSVAELDWEASFAEQIARAKQLGGLTIPRSFVLLGRVLATLAGLLAKYRPAIQLYPLIARHLAVAIG